MNVAAITVAAEFVLWLANFSVERATARVLGCVLGAAALLPSCSREKAIVGYWQWGDVETCWEFRADGSCQTHGEVASKVTGRYNFVSRDKLQIELTGNPNPKIILVSVRGDEMSLTEGKFEMKLHRVDASAIRPEESVR